MATPLPHWSARAHAPLEREVTLDPCYVKQARERLGNRGVNEVLAPVVLAQGARGQNRAQTCRINEVDFLKIDDNFACPVRAHGFQRSVELRRAVQVQLPA